MSVGEMPGTDWIKMEISQRVVTYCESQKRRDSYGGLDGKCFPEKRRFLNARSDVSGFFVAVPHILRTGT